METNHCLFCHRDAEQVPLIKLSYKQDEYWICPQHLPVLIHEPAQLKGKLPGQRNLPRPKDTVIINNQGFSNIVNIEQVLVVFYSL